MNVGLMILGHAAGTEPAAIRTIVTHAERLNFATVYADEHVVLIEDHKSRFPYSADGMPPGTVRDPMLNPFVTLGFAAALTSRIRLATGICLVPQHNPFVLAKEVATLDRLCGGRFSLGVGIGWLEEASEAIGVPWKHRGRRACEYIEAMRVLWSDKPGTFKGEFMHFENVCCFPKPMWGAKLPIFFGGQSEPALRRVARYGNGWFGFDFTPPEAAEKLGKLREMLGEYGRTIGEIEIVIAPKNRKPTLDELKQWRDLGVSELVTGPWGQRTEREHIERLEDLARRWIDPIAALG
jgi:probable F420-dependent oxidoreductase